MGHTKILKPTFADFTFSNLKLNFLKFKLKSKLTKLNIYTCKLLHSCNRVCYHQHYTSSHPINAKFLHSYNALFLQLHSFSVPLMAAQSLNTGQKDCWSQSTLPLSNFLIWMKCLLRHYQVSWEIRQEFMFDACKWVQMCSLTALLRLWIISTLQTRAGRGANTATSRRRRRRLNATNKCILLDSRFFLQLCLHLQAL